MDLDDDLDDDYPFPNPIWYCTVRENNEEQDGLELVNWSHQDNLSWWHHFCYFNAKITVTVIMKVNCSRLHGGYKAPADINLI